MHPVMCSKLNLTIKCHSTVWTMINSKSFCVCLFYNHKHIFFLSVFYYYIVPYSISYKSIF